MRAYDSLEQGLSLSLQKVWERVGMAEAGSNIILLNKDVPVRILACLVGLAYEHEQFVRKFSF